MPTSSMVVTNQTEYKIHTNKTIDLDLTNVQIDVDELGIQPFRINDSVIETILSAYKDALTQMSHEQLCFDGSVAFLVKGKEAVPVQVSSYNRVRKVLSKTTIHLAKSPTVSDDSIPVIFILKNVTPEVVQYPYNELEGSVNIRVGYLSQFLLRSLVKFQRT